MMHRKMFLRATLTLLALATPASALAQQQTTTVNGLGSAQVKPDTGAVSVAVRRSGRDQSDVRDTVNRSTVKIYRRLLALGLDASDITTTGIRLTQRTIRSGKGRRAKHIRYSAVDELRVVTTRLNLLGRIFDTSLRAGATDFGGPAFSLQNPTEARALAVQLASRDARARAEAAATELGMKIVGIQSFDLDGYHGGYPTAVAAPDAGSASPPTTVSPGTAKIEARVRVVFILERA
jgi:uncharacterized protein YggE